jgi:trimethylamine--corrinoid protein Co-methyltransferase
MQARLQILSEEEKHQVHAQSLSLLAKTGVRVDTALGRRILVDAGAHVDPHSHVVRFPRDLVEASLRAAPRQFTLGARRPGWDLPMNAGQCTMLIDGEAMFVLDRDTGERRPGLIEDWLAATRLIDAMDEIGVYWAMLEASDRGDTLADYVRYLCDVFANFTKHVQDATSTPEESRWLLEVLQVIFGDQETIRRTHPLSFLLCPQSPLAIEGPRTDAYLALRGWDVPAAVMPMPLMGGTAPGTLISTVVLGNCEVLATLCLVEAAGPGTPFIYAPALAVMDPRSGRYGGGPVEHGVLGAAAVEMARYYGLPVEATGFSTDHHVPGIQAGYERAMNALLAVLSWPDILVGPGLLSGSMILSFEQLIIDAEIFRRCRRARQGIDTAPGKWLGEVLSQVGPGGSFIAERSTVEAIRSDEWYINALGVHVPFEEWDVAGRPTLLAEARAEVDRLLGTHDPLPLDRDVEKELARIVQRARASNEQ